MAATLKLCSANSVTPFKNTLNRIYLGDTGLNLISMPTGRTVHLYRATSMMTCFSGLGYNFTGNGYWFKPFLPNVIPISRPTGDNGYVLVAAGYSFSLQ